jgi:hypothetical protein
MPKFFGSAKVLPFRKLPFHHSLIAIRYSLPFCHSPVAIRCRFFPTCRFADLTICRKPGSARAPPSRFPLPRLKFAIWLVL